MARFLDSITNRLMLNDVFFINRKRIRESPSYCFKNPNQAIENEKTKHTMNMKDTRIFGNNNTAD